MIINIASQNPVKIDSVREVLEESGFYPNATFTHSVVSSDVSDQPIGMEETVQGAMNRAKNAFSNCQLSVGIEGGIVEVPLTTTGYMNIAICAIYDGTEFFIGLGPGFELPQNVTEMIVNEKKELDDAMKQLLDTNKQHDKYAGGIISLMTRGKITRKEYTKPAVWMALARMKK